MIRNILLTIAYDGTRYAGWQRQPDQPTVQGEIEGALSELCRQPVQIQGTSRTDAGVHTLGQRAGFSGEFGIPTENIKRALNNLLPEDIRITGVEEKSREFHPRFDATGKTYQYTIVNGEEIDPFRCHHCYYVEKPLDVKAMQKAAEYMVGTHDFACFQAAGGEPRETTVRTITELMVRAEAGEITIRITGDGFLYNMVRIITGTLVDVGLGKLDPQEIPHIIEEKDRTRAGHTAPPQGLYLQEVHYAPI